MTPAQAREALAGAGYDAAGIARINEGANHYIFLVTLADGTKAVCKFARTRESEGGIVPPHTDTLFGGRLSLQRESGLYEMIRIRAGVPTPRVYGMHPSPYGDFLLVEAMPGVPFKQYLRDGGYSARAYTDALRALGRDFAAVQRVRFPSFGNIMEESRIDPPGLTNFADRWNSVLEMRVAGGAKKNAFTGAEADRVRAFFFGRLEAMRGRLDVSAAAPVLTFTDMHAGNFFVDEQGKPSGYFDLESAQAAPAALELYGFRFFLFNFYDAEWFGRAEQAFFEGYAEGGGPYAPRAPFDGELIDYLAACRLLELTNSYWGYQDGVRDTWGERMKALLFRYMETNAVDYSAVGAVWRMRDGQPELPALS